MVTFQLPSGPINIKPLFPAVDLSNVQEYYLEIRNKADEQIIATTNFFLRDDCCEDNVRIFFVNYLGGIDAVNFKYVSIETDIRSSKWRKPLKTPLLKWDGGYQRTNISGLVAVTVETNSYEEEDMDWLEELLATPNAWIQWEGSQGQSVNYLPVTIEDGKFVKRKYEDRYEYPFQLVFTMANDKIILRN